MLKYILNFIELRTKVASVIPFLVGIALFSYMFSFKEVNILNTAIFFIALVLFDMSTTGFNNYVALKHDIKFGENENELLKVMKKKNISNTFNLILISTFVVVAIVLSIILVVLSNYYVLVLGCIAGVVAILYSYGPLPIFKTPLGEIFSGVTMGFILPLTLYFVQDVNMSIEFTYPNLELNIVFYIALFIAFMPLVASIANIMLANNICDINVDKENKRHTLPIIIGRNKSYMLYLGIYAIAYLSIIVGVILNIIPLISLLVLITAIPCFRNSINFLKRPTKKGTFHLTIQNFLLISVSYGLIVMVGVLLFK